MTIEERLDALEKSQQIISDNLNGLVNMVSKLRTYTDADINGTRQSVANITPFTMTKTAYLYDTSIQFDNVPEGNITVYFNPSVISANYTLERIGDIVRLTFDPLEEVTEVTLSIL